jgi:two-component system phosphate regulon response regulator PhoB
MLNKILAVEDAPDYQLLIRATLGRSYELTCVSTLAEARECMSNSFFQLILLDLSLPDGSGLDLCREFQRQLIDSDTPVIMLTGRSQPSDLVQGFSVGADDYMTKPFHPAELLARVDAKILKSKLRAENRDIIQRGPLRFDIAALRLYLNGDDRETQVDVTPVEFRMLLKLAQNCRRALSRRELMSSVWGENIHIEDRSIDKHISSIRKKISPYHSSLKTINGVGYELSV